MKNMGKPLNTSYREDCLIVCFDWNLNKDNATLMIARKEGEDIKVLNSFINKEAVDLYYKLIERE